LKAVFVVERAPFYRLFAPIIDAALARGWQVECWHDYGQPRDGLKGYQFPDVAGAPRFRHGAPAVRTYRDAAEFQAWLTASGADAVIGLGGLAATASTRGVRVSLQSVLDTILRDGARGSLSYDLLAVYSDWWLEWAADHFAATGEADRAAYLGEARARASCVGLPATDAAQGIDPQEVRRRWGIPERQPVVVLFPFPQGVGQARFWPQKIYAEPSRVRQAVNVLAHRRFEYLGDIWRGQNDRALVEALRRFCDRNGAFLLVKSRKKTPIPPYLETLADRCLYDDSYYPATVHEALRIASLSVSYYSAAVLESVALGVPHICLPLSFDDYVGDHPARESLARFFTVVEGGPFQFRGVSTSIEIPSAIDSLPSRGLDEFQIAPDARARYVAKFLTHPAGGGGDRTLAAIEACVSRRGTAVH
jgi:hypothetical protein